METKVADKRSQLRRTPDDRRQSERRSNGDRRTMQVEVEVEGRVAGRRFNERRAEVRRQLNDRRHLLT